MAAAIVSITWGELRLTGDMHMSSCFFTHFVTVGILVGMHFLACATQISPLPSLESAPSCCSLVYSSHGKALLWPWQCLRWAALLLKSLRSRSHHPPTSDLTPALSVGGTSVAAPASAPTQGFIMERGWSPAGRALARART